MRHFALGSVFLLASAQLGLAAIINVVVGGSAGLKFEPDTVVCTSSRPGAINFLMSVPEREYWRRDTFYLQAKEPYHHTVNLGKPMLTSFA